MRMIDADALLEHIKDLPTWWADGGGVYGQAMKYPEGMFDVDDVVASIENAPTLTQPNEPLACEECIYEHNEHENCNYCKRAPYLGDYYYRRPPEGEEDT